VNNTKENKKNKGNIDVVALDEKNNKIVEIVTSRHTSSSYIMINITHDFFGLLAS